MINKDLDPVLETQADLLTQHDAYRVLRRVPKPYTNMPAGGTPPEGKCVAIIDLETSGLNPDIYEIMELSLMLCWLDETKGKVIAHAGPMTWLQEPSVPLDPRISLLTNLTAPMLVGQSINDAAVLALLDRADLIVAHNARFEISWLEKRYPQLCGKAWACSMSDIDWLMAGCDGRAQQHLLAQHNAFSDAHRAGPDVWSLFWLLQQRRAEVGTGLVRSHMQRLIEAAEAEGILVQAKRAYSDKKGALRARGYRWNASEKCWEKEFLPEAVEYEEAWFYRSGLPMPETKAFGADKRHR